MTRVGQCCRKVVVVSVPAVGAPWNGVSFFLAEEIRSFEVNKIISINIGSRFLSLFRIWPRNKRDNVQRLDHYGEQNTLQAHQHQPD